MAYDWHILLLDTKRRNPNRYLFLALADALRRHPSVARITPVNYVNAIHEATRDQQGYNLFLAFDGEDMETAICARLARLCERSILWVTEDPYELRTNLENAKLFDLVLTNDLASVDAYHGRARHCPLAADRTFHFQEIQPGDKHPYLYDVFFAGTAWPNRVALLRDLTTRMTDLKFKIALPSNAYLPHPEIGQPKAAFNWRTPSPEFCKMANRSRITLSLHREFSASDNPALASTPGPRLFEVALAGGFQLADSRLEEISAYYRPDEEYDTFLDSADCGRKIRQYLQEPERRETMARAAQQSTLDRHLYDHRAEAILRFAEEIVPKTDATTPAVTGKRTGRRNLLFVAHNTVAGEAFGGVEVVVQILSEGLREQYNVFCYVPIHPQERSKGAILYGPGLVELERFNFPTIERNSHLSCPVREKTFAQVLDRYAIDLIHYHHLIGHVPSLPLVSKAYGIPATLTVYDYFPACTNFNLLDFERRFCQQENRSIAACDVCLSAMHNFPPNSQQRRRAFYERVLKACDALIFISRDTLNRCEKFFPSVPLAAKSLIIDLPVAYEESGNQTEPSRWKPPYKVVSFGNFTHAKGADVLIRACNQLRDSPFEFHLYGRLDEPYVEILAALKLPNVHIQRQFTPGSLHKVLEDVALSLHISIWPETFCITVAEAMHFGVVPIVTDVGAPDERIFDGINGFKIAANDAGALVDTLKRVAADITLARVCHENIRRHRVHMPQDHVRAMAGHYEGLVTRAHKPIPVVAASEGKLTLQDCGIVLEQVSWCGMPTLGFEGGMVDGVTKEKVPSAREAAGALLQDALDQEDYHQKTQGATSKNGSVYDVQLYAPSYIANRFVNQLRERGFAYTAKWHLKTVAKIFQGSNS